MTNLDRICALIYNLNENTSNLVLNKLLYLIQAYNLVVTGEPAFEEKIESWMYGPVVPKAYYNVKSDENFYKNMNIEIEKGLKKRVEEIVHNFGDADPYMLVNLTHSYEPWKKAWDKGKWNTLIPIEDIEEFHNTKRLKCGGRIF